MKKKFKRKLAAAITIVAMMAIGPGTAHARGTLTVTNTTYAAEAVGPATVIQLDPTGAGIRYAMGVNRLGAIPEPQNFVIRYQLSRGTFVNPLPLPVADPDGDGQPGWPVIDADGDGVLDGDTNGDGIVDVDLDGDGLPDDADGDGMRDIAINLRTGGATFNFVEYDVSLNNFNMAVGSSIIWNGPVVNNVNVTNVGDTLSLTVELRDKNGGILIDDTPISQIVAIFVYAADFWNSSVGRVGVKTDTDTTVDVSYHPPLAGFVSQNDDKPLIAAATVQVRNTTPGVRNPLNPNIDYVLAANVANPATETVTITINDPTGFLGLVSNGLWWDLDDNGTRSANETFTVSGNTATRRLNGNDTGFGSDHKLYYEVDGETMLIGRTLTISGFVNAAIGLDHDLTGNDNWWIWNCASGVVLQAPLFQVPPGWISRFVLTNSCPNDADYNATFLSESGVTVTPGPKSSGIVSGTSTLVLETEEVLTISGLPRGTAIFTVDAPSACIQGLYQVVNPSGEAISNHVMVRPGTN